MTPTLYFDPAPVVPPVLNYNKETRTFSIDASDLPDQDATPIRNYAFQTFWIYSVKTGNRKLFTLDSTVRDADGDVMLWKYRRGAFTLEVFND